MYSQSAGKQCPEELSVWWRKPAGSQTISGHFNTGKYQGSLRSLKAQKSRTEVRREDERVESVFVIFSAIALMILSPTLLQCRDAPAGTGKRENDEKTIDDRTVKFSPCCLEDGMVPSVRFLSSGFECSLQHSTQTCALFTRSPWLVEANFRLDFIGEVILCLLSIRAFLLLSIDGTGFGEPRRRKIGKWDSFLVLPVCIY